MSLSNHDLDAAYTALAKTLTRVGEAQAPLLLSILSLSLIARQDNLGDVLRLIEQAEKQHAVHG